MDFVVINYKVLRKSIQLFLSCYIWTKRRTSGRKNWIGAPHGCENAYEIWLFLFPFCTTVLTENNHWYDEVCYVLVTKCTEVNDLKAVYKFSNPNRSSCCNCTIKPYFFGRAPQQMRRTHRSLKAYCATVVMKMKRKMMSFFFHFSK
jgi:hypothetical protein